MSRIRTQVVLARRGGLPEDVVTNTMHWEDDDPAPFEFTQDRMTGLMNRIEVFYKYLGVNVLSALTATSARIVAYDMSQPQPRVPAGERTFTITTVAGSAPLPAEVAVCLSFQGAAESGVPMARRRGRIFLGPVASSLAEEAAQSPDMRVSQTKLTGILQAAEVMATGSGGAYRLAVYSPTTAALGGPAGDAWNDVTELRMDDAFDTVRSRGARRTKRLRAVIGGDNAVALFA